VIITIASWIDIHLDLSSSLQSQALPAHWRSSALNPPLASCRPSLQNGTSPFFRFQSRLPPLLVPCPLSICHSIPSHPFPRTPFPFSLHSSSFPFHIPPLVTTPTMYRWFGSRLSPRQEATPVPPTPPLIHCRRCSRTFQDDRAYHQHMRTSDHHHLCQRCGNDHETNRALQVVSNTFVPPSYISYPCTRIESDNLYRLTVPTAPLPTNR
jgi:hypothetical protein